MEAISEALHKVPQALSKHGIMPSRDSHLVKFQEPQAKDIVVDSAQGVMVRDTSGKEYMDFTSQDMVLACGYNHPRVIDAIQKQMSKAHCLATDFFLHQPAVDLMERLNKILPREIDQFAFFVTGAEAVDNAIKIARVCTGRQNVITFRGGYHGRTISTMSLSTSGISSKKGYGSLLPGVFVAPFPYCHHCTRGDCKGHGDALQELEDMLKHDTAPEDVAAMIIEPMQGDGGAIPAPNDFLQGLRQLCDKHGIVLIFDEILTGFGRTGRMFGFEHSGVVPDLMTIGKQLASGMPLSMVAMKHKIGTSDRVQAKVGSTFAGHPLSCAAACAAIDTILSDGLVDNSRERGAQMLQMLQRLKADPRYCIGDVRGRGLLLGIELINVPDGTASKVLQACIRKGLLVASAPTYEIITLAPPLIASAAQCQRAVQLLAEALDEVLPAAGKQAAS